MITSKADELNAVAICNTLAIIRKKLTTDFTTQQLCKVIKEKWGLY